MAVIVNDMGEINLDAEEIKTSKVIQEDAEMVEMSNGCICCTLRGDLLKTVKSLSEEGHYDYLVIESTGIGEPLPVAQTFVMDVDSMTSSNDGHHHNDDHKEEKKLAVATDEKKALFHYATLDTLVTVVDAVNVYDVLDSLKTLADKGNVSGMLGNSGAKEDSQKINLVDSYPGGKDAFEAQKQAVVTTAKAMPMDQLRKAVAERGVDSTGKRKELVTILVESLEKELLQRLSKAAVDERSISKLWLDQIEFANVIVVSKAPLLLEKNGGDDKQLKEIENMIKKLNPLAKVVIPTQDKFGDLDVSSTDFTDKDQEAYNWMIKRGWWTDKWGDRRSRLVFIGVDLKVEEICKALNTALLTQEESDQLGGPKGWANLKDPFYNGQLKKMNNSFHQYMANKASLEKQHAKLEEKL